MKIAPIIKAIDRYNLMLSRTGNDKEAVCIDHVLVHTGQHYDIEMSGAFFEELEIPKPDINLEVGSASHAVQTANIMMKCEEILLSNRPDWLMVVGDVNSTMACALVASKLGVKIGHIEAGLRSFDRTMPEEINRIVTDALADLLFTPSEDADQNLLHEGVPSEKIKRVGNIMVDTLLNNVDRARSAGVLDRFGLQEKRYVFVTLHRPSNVDSKESLTAIMEHLKSLSQKLPVVFPMHPRTKKSAVEFGLDHYLSGSQKLVVCNPLGYLDTIGLADKACFVLTDSGGLQEETTVLNVPCLTLRPNTERPITVSLGTNKITSLKALGDDLARLLSGEAKSGVVPPLWDGHTAERIVKIICEFEKRESIRHNAQGKG